MFPLAYPLAKGVPDRLDSNVTIVDRSQLCAHQHSIWTPE
jgi:hypothetical protein